jgi:hypothetical protein
MAIGCIVVISSVPDYSESAAKKVRYSRSVLAATERREKEKNG